MTGTGFSSFWAPLVGRDVELDRVQAAVDLVIGGEGQLVLIAGEPGVGKTRLVEELAALAANQGAMVAFGRVDDLDGAPPYWPWVQLLDTILDSGHRAAMAEALGVDAAVIAAILPAADEFVSQHDPPVELDPAAARFRLHEAIVGFLARVAAQRPLVVVLDDLHWADVSSLELTRFVAARLHRAPVLLAVTYRDVDGGRSELFDDVLGSLARRPGLERIALKGLSEAEVGRFMAQTIGLRPRPRLVAAVHARTEGNPFFVGELARLLHSEGLLSAPGDGTVPVGVRDVVRRRLVRLPRPTNDLLVLGAVLGRDFEIAALVATSALGAGEALDALQPALAAGLITEAGGTASRLRFSHALIRDTIYSDLGALRRATLHAQVGGALERRLTAGPSQLTELAWHFFNAAPILGPARGLLYSLQASDAAQAAVSYERAEEDLRRALALVEQLPPGGDRLEQELDVLNRLVVVIAFRQGYATPEVERIGARAQELCEQIGETDGLFKTLNNRGMFHHLRGDLRIEAEVGSQLLTIGRQRSSTKWLTAGYLFLGMAQLHVGDLLAARRTLKSVRDVAATLDPSTEVAESFFGLHPAVVGLAYSSRLAWVLGEEAEAYAFAAEAVQVATRVGHPHTLVGAWYFAGHLQILDGDAPGVLALSETAITFSDEHGLATYGSWFRLFRGWALSQQGRADEGVAAMTVEVAANHASGAGTNKPVFLALLAEGEARRGDTARALAIIEQALAEIGEAVIWESDLYRRRGQLLAAQGPEHNAAAVDSLRRAVAVAATQGSVWLEQRAEAALALVKPTRDLAGPEAAPGVVSNLSPRERQLLGLVARGCSDKEIAAQLVISLATVRSHLDRIRDKTGRRRRVELTRLADELGLIST